MLRHHHHRPPRPRVLRLRLAVYPSSSSSSGPLLTTTPAFKDLDLDLTQEGSLLQRLKGQIAQATGIKVDNQHLSYGDASYPLQDDVDVQALLLNHHHHHHHEDQEPPPPRVSINVIPMDLLDSWKDGGGCTRIFCGDKTPLIQPAYLIPGSEKKVCQACSIMCFPEGLLMPAQASLEPFVCAAAELCADGLGTYLFQDRVEEAKAALIIHAEENQQQQQQQQQQSPPPPPPPSPALLAMRIILQQAAYAQQTLGFDNNYSAEARNFMGRLQSGAQTAQEYESPALKNKALGVIPLATLHHRALAAGGDPQREPLRYHDLLFKELLAWFKQFFTWVNQPPCDRCGSKETTLVGGAAPNPAEAAGKAGRVEVYKCNVAVCGSHTRFPRYNDSGKLLETRRGRCGEWANCFTLCARAMGFDARYCMDWTDHVWTEVWSEAEGKWLHADSCENALDSPLMYEAGWGKKLTYVVAFSRNACVDVTKRYTAKFDEELLARRTELPEVALAQQVAELDRRLRLRMNAMNAKKEEAEQLLRCARREQFELHHYHLVGRNLQQLKASERIGRISGNAAWKRARGEDGLGGAGGGGSAGGCGGGGNSSLLLNATCAVPPVVGGGSEEDLQTLVFERDEVVGLPLWSVAGAGADALIVSATSVGSAENTLLLHSSSNSYGADAISINGMPVAVGRKGLNVVVLDLAKGVIERSVAFDMPTSTSDKKDGGTDVIGGGSLLVTEFLRRETTMERQQRFLIAVVLGSAGELLGQAAVGVKAPGPGEPWLVITGGGEDKAADWNVAETRALGQGPLVKAVVSIPFRWQQQQQQQQLVWEDAIASLPLVHDMGPFGDGNLASSSTAAATATTAATTATTAAAAVAETAFENLRTVFPHAPLAGYSYKPGCGLVAFARSNGGIRAGAGWTTRLLLPLLPPTTTTPESPDETETEEDPRVLMKRTFDGLVAQGLAPNVAASQALATIKQEMEAKQQRKELLQESLATSTSPPPLRLVYGPLCGPSPRPAAADVLSGFDDTEVAFPYSAMVHLQQQQQQQQQEQLSPSSSSSFPILTLRQVRLWTSARGIVGLQAGYDGFSSSSSLSSSSLWWAPAHHSATSASASAATNVLVLAPEEGLVHVRVRMGEHGIVESLQFVTTTNREVSFGGGGAGAGTTAATAITTATTATPGRVVLSFWGTLGREGLQSLGVVMTTLVASSTNTSIITTVTTAAPSSFPVPAAWSVYTSCDIEQAAGLLLFWSGKEKTLKALRAARRYLENCVKDPCNVKFRQIRVRSKYFYDNIGSVAGSGALLKALGFQHVAATVAEEAAAAAESPQQQPQEEACYSLPLACVSPVAMKDLIARIDKAVGLVEKEA